MKFSQAFLTIFFVSHWLHLCAQSPIPSNQYNTSNGLKSSTVYQITQDNDRLYWLGTDDGLVCFNGINFTKTNSLNTKSIQNITQLISTPNDQIVYSSFKEGIFQFNARTKKLKQITPELKNDSIRDFFEFPDKIMHLDDELLLFKSNRFYASNQLFIYNTKTKNQKNLSDVIDVLQTKNTKTIYILKSDGIYLYTKSGLTSVYTNHSQAYTPTTRFFILDNETIYCCGSGKIFEIRNKKIIQTLDIPELKNKSIISLSVDDYDNIWLITHDYNFYLFKKNNLTLIENGTIKHSEIYIDDNNNLFMASYSDGLYVYYNTFIKNFGPNQGITNKSINKIEKINNSIYLCTNNGIYKYEKGKLNYIQLKAHDIAYVYNIVEVKNKIFAATIADENMKTPTEQIYSFHSKCIYKLTNNWCISSGWNNEICIYYDFPDAKQTSHIFLPNSLTKSTVVNNFYQINDSAVYAITNNALYLINVYKKTAKEVKTFKEKINNISYSTNNNTYYFGSNNGIYTLKNNTYDSIKQIGPYILGKVNACIADKKGNLWIATQQNGVFIYNKNYSTSINVASGLISNEILSLYYDSHKNDMFIGTKNGFSEIDLDQFYKIPKPDLNVKINYISTGEDTVYNYNNHTFSYKENSIQIVLNNTYYRNNSSVKLRYNLDGNETETTLINTLKFNSLSTESHILTLKLSLDGINWGKETVVNFSIEKPFLKSEKFYLMISIISITIVIWLSTLIIDKIKRENERKIVLQNENNKLKFQALNASINPHFIFNALYSIQNFVYNNKGNIASDYLGKLSRLIRITLEQAENIEISLKDEIEKLNFYMQLEKLRFGDKINICFENTVTTNPELILIPNMIIQPIIENAIIHGLNNRPNNGNIKIHLSEDLTMIYVIIEDNGIGINKTTHEKKPNHKSIGLKNVKQRIALIENASITLTDKSETDSNQTGTIAKIALPKKIKS